MFHIHQSQRRKLESRTIRYVFMRYFSTQKGKHSLSIHREIVCVHDVTFNETNSFFTNLIIRGRVYEKIGETHFLTFLSCTQTRCFHYLNLSPHQKIKIHKINPKPHKRSVARNLYRTHVLSKYIQEGKTPILFQNRFKNPSRMLKVGKL